MSERFDEPVVLNVGSPPVRQVVRTASQASEMLVDVDWPVRGPRHRDATATCIKVIEGTRSAEDARNAFVDAAREAGILGEVPSSGETQ